MRRESLSEIIQEMFYIQQKGWSVLSHEFLRREMIML